MTRYRRLTQDDKCHIEDHLSRGNSVAFIATFLGMHRSTVYRELHRGRIAKRTSQKEKGEYSARASQARFRSVMSDSRAGRTYPRRKIHGWVEDQIILKLYERWSPEQIAHRLWIDQRFSLSTEAIYQYILAMKQQGQSLHRLLRQWGRRPHRAKRRSRYWELQKRRRRSIDDRPAAARRRRTVGHWERDLMLGRRNTGAVLTLVDRKSLWTSLTKLENAHCAETNQKTVEALHEAPIICKTLTNDNGPEFGEFWNLEAEIHRPVFFCHPHAPWERGRVEQTIGLLRTFLPKSCDLRRISSQDLTLIQTSINHRPRKTLGFRTPFEIVRGRHRKLITRTRIADLDPIPEGPAMALSRAFGVPLT